MPDSSLQRTWQRIRYYRSGLPWYGMALRIAIDGFSKLGLRFEPYQIFLESLENAPPPDAPPNLGGLETGFLLASDMREVAIMPARSLSEEDLKGRLKSGSLCFGIKHRGAIVAFTWCNLTECTIEKHRLFLLREDEASLFDAYTLESFRGHGLAPFMRYLCYEEMAALGRKRCYSVTIIFNRPAARFKQKLGAQIVNAGVYVELLGRWRLHLRVPAPFAPHAPDPSTSAAST